MSTAEHRGALRIPCAYPVRVAARGRTYTGTMQDVSRTGLRMWIPTGALGTDEDSLLVVAQLVDELMGSRFQGDLHHEMLGPLVRKRMHLVRLGQSDAQQAVELGCEFDEPLTDEETGMLGLGLPQLGVTTAEAYRHVPAPRKRSAASQEEPPPLIAPKGYDAYVHPTDGLPTEPLAGETYGIKDQEAVVRAQRTADLAADIPSLTIALAKGYGPEPVLEILDGLRMVWSGKADIRRVELTGPKGVRIHMQGRD